MEGRRTRGQRRERPRLPVIGRPMRGLDRRPASLAIRAETREGQAKGKTATVMQTSCCLRTSAVPTLVDRYRCRRRRAEDKRPTTLEGRCRAQAESHVAAAKGR